MPQNVKEIIDKLRAEGVPEDRIQKYLHDKGLSGTEASADVDVNKPSDQAAQQETESKTNKDFVLNKQANKKPWIDEDGEEINLAKDFGETGALIESLPFFGDVIDDLYGAVKTGRAQARSVDDALNLFKEGKDISEEDLQEYLARVKEMEGGTTSNEMKEFNQIYDDAGGGTWGFVKAIASRPQAAAETMVSSLVAMANPASLAGAGVTAAAGAGAGSVLPGIGTAIGATSGAVAGASATLDTAMSFTEFLQEEVANAGLEFDEEGVAAILNDPKALGRVRTRSAARGAVIGLVDGLTGGIAGKVTKAGVKLGKSAAKAGAKGFAIEAAGGGIGETAGRLTAGQELDAREIGLEIVGEFGQAVPVVRTALKEAKGAQPEYTIKGEKFDQADTAEFIANAPDDEVLGGEVDIKNDDALREQYLNRLSGIADINRDNDVLTDDQYQAKTDQLSKIKSLYELKQEAETKGEKKALQTQINKARAGLKETVKEQRESLKGLSPIDRDVITAHKKEVDINNFAISQLEAKAKINPDKADSINNTIKGIKEDNAELTGEVDAIRANQEQKVTERKAKKEEAKQEEAVEQEAEDVGITPEEVIAQKEEIQKEADEEAADNKKGFNKLNRAIVQSGVKIVDAEGTVSQEQYDTKVPLSKGKEGYSFGDFEKKVESFQPMERAVAEETIYAIEDEVDSKGYNSDVKVVDNGDGTFGIEGTISSPEREAPLSDKFKKEAAPQEEQAAEEFEQEAFGEKKEAAPKKEPTPKKKVKEEAPAERTPAQAALEYAESEGKDQGGRAYKGEAPKEVEGGVLYPGLKPHGQSLKEAGVYSALGKLKKAGYDNAKFESTDGGVKLVPGEKITDTGVNLSLKEAPQTKSEVDRIKSLPIESEDGATFNQDGTKYEGGGLVLPIASENFKASELTPQKIEEFKQKHKAYLGEASKIGIYKFPGQDQASIDLNVIVPSAQRERAVAIGKKLGQESLFDLDTFENVKTGETGANPKTIGPSAAKRIADEFVENDRDLGILGKELKKGLPKPSTFAQGVKQDITKSKPKIKESDLAAPNRKVEGGAIQDTAPKEGTESFDAAFDRSDVGKSTTPRQDIRGKGIKGTKGKPLFEKVDAVLEEYNNGDLSDNSLIEKLGDYVLNNVPKIVTTNEGGSKISEGQAEFEGIQASEDTRAHSRSNIELEGFALERFADQVKAGKFKGITGKQALTKAKAIAKSSKSLKREAIGESKDRQRISNVARRAEQAFYAEHGYDPGIDQLSDYINDNKSKYNLDTTPEKIELARRGELPSETGARVEGQSRDTAQTKIAKEAGLDQLTDQILSPTQTEAIDLATESILDQSPEINSSKDLQDIRLRRGATFGEKVKGDPAASRIKKAATEINKDIQSAIGEYVKGPAVSKAFPVFGEQFGFKQANYNSLDRAQKQNFRRRLIDGLAFEAEQRLGSLGKTTPSPKLNLEKARGSKSPADIAATPKWTQAVSKALSRAFPSVDVISTQEGFNNVTDELQRAGHTLPADIKGLQYANKVAINPSRATKDTAIHEFSHIWASQLQRTNPKLWKRGVELLKGSEYMRVIADNPYYRSYLKDNPSKFYEEVMANALGKRGAEIFARNNEKAGAWDNFINKVGSWIKNKLDISSKKDYMDLTLDDWLNAGASSVLTGDKSAFSTPMDQKAPSYSLEEDVKTNLAASHAKGVAAEPKWYKPKDWGRLLVPPAADDYHGLLQRADIVKESKPITDAFVSDHHNYLNESTRVRESIANNVNALKKAGIKLSKKGVAEIDGQKLNAAQAIQAHVDGYPTAFSLKPEVQKYINNMRALGPLQPNRDVEKGYIGANPNFDTVDYIANDLYQLSFQNFNALRNNHFNEAKIKSIREKSGPGVSKAIETALGKMSTGKSSGFTSPTTGKWNNFLLGSVGVTMFFNGRSAALQTLSTLNYGFDSKNPIRYYAELSKVAGSWFVPGSQANKDFKALFNSDFLKERRARAGVDVTFQEMVELAQGSSYGDFTKKLLNTGFKATTYADSFAVALGGVAMMRSNKTSINPNDKKWIETSEESQQSSRPDRTSAWQTDSIAKYVLAFANTPQQYFRLSQKALRSIKEGKDVKKNVGKLIYYMGAQNALFTTLQGATYALIPGIEDDKEEEKVVSAINSVSESILRGMGLYGAVINTIKNVAVEGYKQKQKARPQYEKAFLKGLTISPPLQHKIRNLEGAGRALTKGEYGTAAAKTGAVANLPTDWVLKKYNAAAQLNEDKYNEFQKALLLIGWSEYDFDYGK